MTTNLTDKNESPAKKDAAKMAGPARPAPGKKDGSIEKAKKWYAVHTYSGHENKVKTNIERRAESLGLKDKITRILVPVEEETRNRNGRRTQIKRKVFPGYLLIEMELNDSTWYLVKNTIGVTGFVSSGNKPVPIQEREISNILESLDAGVRKAKPTWQKGEVVRV